MSATLYDYTIMPGEAWYGPQPGKFLEETHSKFRDAAHNAKAMWKAGVRDIVINVYDLIGQDLADFYYKVDDATGKLIKK